MNQAIDYSKWKAVLLRYENEGIYSFENIYYAKNSLELFKEVMSVIHSQAESLCEHYHEYINMGEFDDFFEENDVHFNEEEKWDWVDVMDLLDHLLKEHLEILEKNPDRSMLGEWKNLLDSINDHFPNNSYLSLRFESCIPEFADHLIEYLLDYYRSIFESTLGKERKPEDLWLYQGADIIGNLIVLRSSHPKIWLDKNSIHYFSSIVKKYDSTFTI